MPKSASSGERNPEDVPKRRPPARSRDRRINQLTSMAEDLVEERIRLGTASPTEVAAVLRYGSPTELANLERIQAQTSYLRAQEAKAVSETLSEKMFTDAMEAMSGYKRGLDHGENIQ